MKSSLCLKGVAVGALMLAASAAEDYKTPDLYVAVPCPLSLLRIIDWGKCHTAGDQWDCPTAHIAFRTDCVALRKQGKVQFRLNVDRPTVLIDDGKGDSAQEVK